MKVNYLIYYNIIISSMRKYNLNKKMYNSPLAKNIWKICQKKKETFENYPKKKHLGKKW